ncbi:YbhB/YbcL family Raf kinase inhibitor-like protein [Chromohalobacter nigrandesensis]|uniref:YbhB/YbcL family Raf kinase inhibitor-like protein n=1 Tax=Chromohalobacter nigrandesensis TaxID=119863 RepID=UPI001FF554C8|nr:hypothetical protein [Chromohalobacter nigrandesensis]MCK0746340.1 hypothetical protein [Chromohalobacter nigrandesensis]
MPFAPPSMQVESTAFTPNGAIPKRHSAEGDDVSPALSWKDASAKAKGFVVICHDPDMQPVKDGCYGYMHLSTPSL